MMMILGMFVFSLKTTPYQTFEHTKSWRYPTNNRLGRIPALQFTGKDNEQITLSGVLMPEITGGKLSLVALELMADLGKPWPLIERSGIIYGMFVIESISQTKTNFFKDGTARKIEFTIQLKRVDDGLKSLFTGLTERLAGLL